MGTTSEKLTYLNTTKGLIKDKLNLGGANITTEPFRAYSSKLMGIYKDFLAHGTDELWNNWEKVEGEGETLTLNNTMEGKMKVELKGNTQQGLPSEYQAVEYIESSGTQYIDTGLKGKNAISIDTDYSITSATTWSSILGCANGTAGNSVACVIGITKNGSINGGWYWRNTTNEQFDSNNVAQLDLKTNLKASATSFVFKNTNGTKTYSFSKVNSFETTPNMYIFASNKNGTINDYSKIKLYYMKIFDGTTLKREYLPCYRISDNVIGLYDMVENKFYTNAGTGTFTKGSNTTLPTPDYPQDIHVVSGDNTIKVEGKNILDYTNNVIPNSFIVTAQLRIDGVSGGTTTWAKVEPNATYTVSRDNGNRLIIAGSNTQPTLNGLVDTIIYDGGTSTATSYTFTNGNYNYVAIYVSRDTEHTPSWVQLEKNNQATTYTPYVSQSYPISLENIELCKIGTYQDKIAKSTGKNLFDKDTITENTYIDENGNTGTSSVTNLSDYIELKPNTSYTLSYDYSTLLNSNQRNVCYYNENKTFISSDVYIPADKTHAITTPNNAKYIRFSYDKNCYSIMLNEGNTALPYEPYGKVWYLNKQIGKVVLDGSEDWTKGSQTNVSVFVLSNVIYPQVYGENGVGLSNRFKYEYVNNANAFYFGWSNNVVIVMPNTYTLESFKTWLSSNNTSVYYITTPTYEEITDTTLLSQLEALAYSYEGTTNISQVNDDMPFILDLTALKEMS